MNDATIGIEDDVGVDGLEFANNSSPAVTDSMSILFFGDQVTSANASIAPDTVLLNAPAQEFVYKITDIKSDADSIGRADHVIIDNPFTSESITVLSIKVDSIEYFIQRSQILLLPEAAFGFQFPRFGFLPN